jgi:hypothetical protein
MFNCLREDEALNKLERFTEKRIYQTTQRYSVFYGPIIVAAHEFVSYGIKWHPNLHCCVARGDREWPPGN